MADEYWIDSLSRVLAMSGNRREVLARLGGLTGAALLALFGVADVAAGRPEPEDKGGKKKPPTRQCSSDADCKGCGTCGFIIGGQEYRACIPSDQKCGACRKCKSNFKCTRRCGKGEVCDTQGQCCKSPLCNDVCCEGLYGPIVGCCEGRCRSLRTEENCGRCGNRCKPDEECRESGVCACRPPLTRCGTACCDLNINECCNGKCCEWPHQRCCDGSCVDVRTNLSHCGTYRRPCQPGEACVDGLCTCAPSGQRPAQVGELCCPAGQEPCGSSCCPPTLACCDGGCVDKKTDYRHCGACGNRCSGSLPLCCDGQCKEGVNDRQNCGACGRVCAGDQSCFYGVCLSCPSDRQCGVFEVPGVGQFPYCCGEGEVCKDASRNLCCEPNRELCDDRCCPAGEVCIEPATGFCCPVGKARCGNGCCEAGRCFPCSDGGLQCCPSPHLFCTGSHGCNCCESGLVCHEGVCASSS